MRVGRSSTKRSGWLAGGIDVASVPYLFNPLNFVRRRVSLQVGIAVCQKDSAVLIVLPVRSAKRWTLAAAC